MNPYMFPGLLENLTGPEVIAYIVGEYFGVTLKDLRSPDRHRPLPDARYIVFFLIWENYPKMKLGQIGEVLNRDHSTVIYAIRKVQDYLSYDNEYANDFEIIKNKVS